MLTEIVCEAQYSSKDLPRLIEAYEKAIGRVIMVDKTQLHSTDYTVTQAEVIELINQLENVFEVELTPTRINTSAREEQYESVIMREEQRSPASAKKLREYEQKIYDLELQVEALQTQSASKSTQLSMLKQELSKQKQLLLAQQQENVDKLKEVNALRIQLERYAQQCQLLEQDISQLQKSQENRCPPQTPSIKANKLKALEETPLFKQLKEEGLDDRIMEVLDKFEDVGNVQTDEMLTWLQELKVDVSTLLNDVLQQVEALKQVRTKYKNKIKNQYAEITALKQVQPKQVDQSVSKVMQMLEQKNQLVTKYRSQVEELNQKRSPWMLFLWLLMGCCITVMFVVYVESSQESQDYFPESVFIQQEPSIEWLWALLA